jgi:hypothetical protein
MKPGVLGVPFSLCLAVTLIPRASASPLTATGMAAAECGATQTYNSVSPSFSVATQGSASSSGVCTPLSASSITAMSSAVAGGVSGSSIWSRRQGLAGQALHSGSLRTMTWSWGLIPKQFRPTRLCRCRFLFSIRLLLLRSFFLLAMVILLSPDYYKRGV